MRASFTAIMLVPVAAGFTSWAFRLAHRESRAVRALAAWPQTARAALPWLSRRLFAVPGIDTLRRAGVGEATAQSALFAATAGCAGPRPSPCCSAWRRSPRSCSA